MAEPRRRGGCGGLIALVIVIGIIAAIAGQSDDGAEDGDGRRAQEQPGEKSERSPRCRRARAAAVQALDDSLTVQGRLTKAQIVRSEDEATLGGFRRSGLLFLSAELEGPNLEEDGDVATWAVSGEFARTGGGLAIAVDNFAEEFSDAGAEVNEGRLGIDFGTDGFNESRSCVDAAG